MNRPIASTLAAAGLLLFFVLILEIIQPSKWIISTQQLTSSCFTQDALVLEVELYIRTKENLSNDYIIIDAKQFIQNVCARHQSSNIDAMALMFKNSAVKFLRLPPTAVYVKSIIRVK